MPLNGQDLYIFQMASTGDIKVGRSKHVGKRLKEVQTGCPHPLRMILHVPNAGHREKEIHRLMSGRHIRKKGEWFAEGALAELPPDMYEQLDLTQSDWWISQ